MSVCGTTGPAIFSTTNQCAKGPVGEVKDMRQTSRFAQRLLVFMLLVLSPWCFAAQDHLCTNAEAARAEGEAGLVRSWDALYKWYRAYRKCNDGVIAETSSAAIGTILTAHWSTLPRLAPLAGKDAAFRKFVLQGFGATIEMDDMERKHVEIIKRRARTHVPQDSALCAMI